MFLFGYDFSFEVKGFERGFEEIEEVVLIGSLWRMVYLVVGRIGRRRYLVFGVLVVVWGNLIDRVVFFLV